MGDLGRTIDHMRCFVDVPDLIHDPFLTVLRTALAAFSPAIIPDVETPGIFSTPATENDLSFSAASLTNS